MSHAANAVEPKIIASLIGAGKLTLARLHELEAEARMACLPLADILQQQQLVTEEAVAEAYATHYELKYVTIDPNRGVGLRPNRRGGAHPNVLFGAVSRRIPRAHRQFVHVAIGQQVERRVRNRGLPSGPCRGAIILRLFLISPFSSPIRCF